MNIVAGQGMPDMCMLTEVSENSFINNMITRFNASQIYTYIGEQVISVNPYRKMDIYTQQVLDTYRNRYMYEVHPHIYALADDTFRSLMQNKFNQCVIITGESGAGKTEASKVFMQYISAVSRGGTRDADAIKTKLLDSNPILEAFGNAKTVRNDNSSRFGKYMEIQFDGAGAPVGGQITQYLLEKSRVVTRAQGERSFHVFYQLLTQRGQMAALKLTGNAADYRYLSMSACTTVSTINDATDFTEMSTAMDRLGWAAADKANVFKILAAILHVGNINYETDTRSATCDTVKITNLPVVKTIAELLQLDQRMFEISLMSRSIATGAGRRQSTISVPLNLEQAVFTRDALAKALYSELFTWVVNRINENIHVLAGRKAEVNIGVLDIYGFEIFEKNSFEQFCINYCNEKLQKLFIERVLRQEQEEYVREGIEWRAIDYFNNEPICQLIEARHVGVYAMLDEACLVGQSTPQTLVDKFDKQFGNHAHYQSYKKTKDKTIGPTGFRIKHYAGDVTYSTDEFLPKNRDLFYADLVAALQSSENQFLLGLFPIIPQKEKDKKRPETAGNQFMKAVNGLIDTLNACMPHYIRCIKSNDDKRAGFLNEERVRHQVRYLNLVETLRVRKAGFCNRQPYDRFLARYKMLSDKTWPIWKGSHKDGVQNILNSLGIKKEEYRMGKTQLFTRDAQTLCKYEEERGREMPKVAIMIQKLVKGHQTRKWFKVAIEELRRQRAELAIRMHQIAMSNRIKKGYVNYKMRLYVKALNTVFRDCKNDKSSKYGARYGRGRAFPTPWRRWVLTGAPQWMEKMHLVWWARMKITSLTDTENSLMRQKIIAYDIFHGNKPWNCARTFEADYLDVATNQNRALYEMAIRDLFQTYGDSEILFSDDVLKVNPKMKAQLRTVIVTNDNIYKYDAKKYEIKKSGIPISEVSGISVSPFRDTYVIVHLNSPLRDLIIDAGTNGCERVSELVTVIVKRVREIKGQCPVQFTEHITFNNSREADSKDPTMLKNPGQDIQLTFAINAEPKPDDPPSVFVKGKKNVCSVLYT